MLTVIFLLCSFTLALGVVASVVPFNFPVMVPMWTLPIAIAMGMKCLLIVTINVVKVIYGIYDSLVAYFASLFFFK